MRLMTPSVLSVPTVVCSECPPVQMPEPDTKINVCVFYLHVLDSLKESKTQTSTYECVFIEENLDMVRC